MQLLGVMYMWTESLESSGQIDVIHTDLEKAFYKVPHKRLISKLYSYKINPEVIKWMESFLVKEDKGLELMVFSLHSWYTRLYCCILTMAI